MGTNLIPSALPTMLEQFRLEQAGSEYATAAYRAMHPAGGYSAWTIRKARKQLRIVIAQEQSGRRTGDCRRTRRRRPAENLAP
jgi:hypothetical protein